MQTYYAISGKGEKRFLNFHNFCREGFQWEMMNKNPPPSEKTKESVYLLSISGEAVVRDLPIRVLAMKDPLQKEIKHYIERHWDVSLAEISPETEMMYLDAEAIPGETG